MATDDYQGQPQKATNTTTKVLLILLAVFGGALLVCCGFCGFMGYSFQPEMTDEADAVRARTQEIANIEIPEQFEPDSAGKIDNFLMQMNVATYESTVGQGQLMLAQMNFKLFDMPQEQQEAQIQQSLEEQQGEETRNLDIQESETRQFQINGKEVSFIFAEGEERRTGDKFHQVSGTFPGKEGTTFLMLQLDEEAYDEEAVVRMIESIGRE